MMRLLGVAAKAALLLCTFVALQAYAVCPPDNPDRYEEDPSGYCYDRWTGEYFNDFESIRPGDPGHPQPPPIPGGDLSDYYWNGDRREWELIEDWSITVDWCTWDFWVMEVDFCRWSVQIEVGPVVVSSDPDDS